MSGFVVDSSIALAWCFEDEKTPGTDALYDQFVDNAITIPPLWVLEILNVMELARRKKRISVKHGDDFWQRIMRGTIVVDQADPFLIAQRLPGLMRTHLLTAYDATYLELAMRLQLPLATKDGALVKAAKKAGLVVLN
jgi:predicted nucleic acid-binding protein